METVNWQAATTAALPCLKTRTICYWAVSTGRRWNIFFPWQFIAASLWWSERRFTVFLSISSDNCTYSTGYALQFNVLIAGSTAFSAWITLLIRAIEVKFARNANMRALSVFGAFTRWKFFLVTTWCAPATPFIGIIVWEVTFTTSFTFDFCPMKVPWPWFYRWFLSIIALWKRPAIRVRWIILVVQPNVIFIGTGSTTSQGN